MLLAAVAALLLGQAPPAPADFAATFTPEAVASHLEGKVAYLVAGAGPATPALASAAAAVEDGLRRSGKAELVMNGASLGPVAELDDQALVKKCQPLPVVRVAVVRVFESAGEAPRAVVAVYDKQGTVQVAFTAQAGQPLVAGKEAAVATGLGVSAAVARDVMEANAGPAHEEYDKSFLSFADVVAVNQQGQVTGWTTPLQGKAKRPLEGDEFYKVIGRDDLLAQYQANVKSRRTVQLVGVAIAVGVPILAFLARGTKDCGPDPSPANPGSWEAFFACDDANTSANMRALTIGGLGVMGGLAIATWGADSVKLHPIDGSEAHRLGDEYNAKLKARLGVAQAPAGRASPATEVRVSLAPVRGGGMVGLALTF